MNESLLAMPVRVEFRARLDRAREESSSLETSFSQEWAAGRLNRRQMGFWAMQHWYYIDRIPQQFGIIYTRCPDVDTRLFILEYLHQALGERFLPIPLHVQYVKAGRLGRKVGRGVYDYPAP